MVFAHFQERTQLETIKPALCDDVGKRLDTRETLHGWHRHDDSDWSRIRIDADSPPCSAELSGASTSVIVDSELPDSNLVDIVARRVGFLNAGLRPWNFGAFTARASGGIHYTLKNSALHAVERGYVGCCDSVAARSSSIPDARRSLYEINEAMMADVARHPSRVVKAIALQLVSAIAHANGLGIAHQNVNTANIMIQHPGFHVQLTGWGAAPSVGLFAAPCVYYRRRPSHSRWIRGPSAWSSSSA